jgi:hypothetical protein
MRYLAIADLSQRHRPEPLQHLALHRVSSRAPVVGRRSCRVGSQSRAESTKVISPGRGSSHVADTSGASISVRRRSAFVPSRERLAVGATVGIAVAELVVHDAPHRTRPVTRVEHAPFDGGHQSSTTARRATPAVMPPKGAFSRLEVTFRAGYGRRSRPIPCP